jgi:hypothetical protein
LFVAKVAIILEEYLAKIGLLTPDMKYQSFNHTSNFFGYREFKLHFLSLLVIKNFQKHVIYVNFKFLFSAKLRQ